MTVEEFVEGLQFTVDRQGKVTAVVVEPDLWRRIMDALEDVEDRDLVRRLQESLVAGPSSSAALRWRDVADEWQ